MKILLFILAIFFLLVATLSGYLTWFYFDLPVVREGNIFGERVPLKYLFSVVTTFAFLISVVLLASSLSGLARPRRRRRMPLKKITEETRKHMPRRAAAAKADQGADGSLHMSAASSSASASRVPGSGSDVPPEEFSLDIKAPKKIDEPLPTGDDYDPELTRLKTNQLVAIGQKKIDRNVAAGIINEYYPELLESTNRFLDEVSLSTFTQHLIQIVRIKLKILNPDLLDDQFSIFQRRIFDDEDKEILMMYAPDETKGLNSFQMAHYGKLVDHTSWKALQRKVHGLGSDWKSFTVNNGEELLKKTSAGVKK